MVCRPRTWLGQEWLDRWTSVVRIRAQPEDEPYEIHYNLEGLLDVSLERASVQEVIDHILAPPAPPEWSL